MHRFHPFSQGVLRFDRLCVLPQVNRNATTDPAMSRVVSDLLQIPSRDRHKPAEVLSQVQEVSFQWSHLPATASESQAEDWNLHGMAWNCLK